MSCHSLLACRVSAEKSAVNLMGVPLYVICYFSLFAFNNFSLSLIFVNLITMCLGMFLLGFILPGTLCASWTWVAISFPMLGKFSTLISSNIFSGPFSLSFPSGTRIMRMLLRLMLSQRSLRLSSFLFILFSSVPHRSSFFLTSPLTFLDIGLKKWESINGKESEGLMVAMQERRCFPWCVPAVLPSSKCCCFPEAPSRFLAGLSSGETIEELLAGTKAAMVRVCYTLW